MIHIHNLKFHIIFFENIQYEVLSIDLCELANKKTLHQNTLLVFHTQKFVFSGTNVLCNDHMIIVNVFIVLDCSSQSNFNYGLGQLVFLQNIFLI